MIEIHKSYAEQMAQQSHLINSLQQSSMIDQDVLMSHVKSLRTAFELLEADESDQAMQQLQYENKELSKMVHAEP